jgi:type I restriction enzyme M protein
MGIVGAILGDIAGSQYEFSNMRPDDLDWKHCDLFTKKCRFTDDTVMTIACYMAILEDKENPNLSHQEAHDLANLTYCYSRAEEAYNAKSKRVSISERNRRKRSILPRK